MLEAPGEFLEMQRRAVQCAPRPRRRPGSGSPGRQIAPPGSHATDPTVEISRSRERATNSVLSRTFPARIGVMKALNRHVERVFNPDRKDTQWGKRELKRDT